MYWDLILSLGGFGLIIYYLVCRVDWDKVEEWRWEKVKHTALTDEEFKKHQKLLDEPPDQK